VVIKTPRLDLFHAVLFGESSSSRIKHSIWATLQSKQNDIGHRLRPHRVPIKSGKSMNKPMFLSLQTNQMDQMGDMLLAPSVLSSNPSATKPISRKDGSQGVSFSDSMSASLSKSSMPQRYRRTSNCSKFGRATSRIEPASLIHEDWATQVQLSCRPIRSLSA